MANNFDFWLVVVCYIPPGLLGGNFAFLRLLRLMRLFKLVKKVKKINAIVSGLFKGLGAVGYILLLLVLVFYLFAVLGVQTFRRNDPLAFGGIGIAVVTLFRIITLDNWTSLIYLNWFGCDSQNISVDGVSRETVYEMYNMTTDV